MREEGAGYLIQVKHIWCVQDLLDWQTRSKCRAQQCDTHEISYYEAAYAILFVIGCTPIMSIVTQTAAVHNGTNY